VLLREYINKVILPLRKPSLKDTCLSLGRGICCVKIIGFGTSER